jgi:branched-chain amino acid transport system substrate-binding protein
VWGHRATEEAIKKINAEGGIKGRKLQYVFEDTETNVQTGIRKMRKLIEGDEVDFIVGSVHSGINIACAPIARELNTVYFGFGTAVETTEEKGNRYVFRGMTNGSSRRTADDASFAGCRTPPRLGRNGFGRVHVGCGDSHIRR